MNYCSDSLISGPTTSVHSLGHGKVGCLPEPPGISCLNCLSGSLPVIEIRGKVLIASKIFPPCMEERKKYTEQCLSSEVLRVGLILRISSIFVENGFLILDG